jgi:hypothetical protein
MKQQFPLLIRIRTGDSIAVLKPVSALRAPEPIAKASRSGLLFLAPQSGGIYRRDDENETLQR